MRIYTGGIATETNTFSPLPTGLADYEVWRASDPESGKGFFFSAAILAFQEMARARGWDLEFSLQAFAQPAGLTVRSVYESLRDEFLGGLEAVLPVDIVLLSLHGAMVAEGYDECETDILQRVRQRVGARTKIGVLLDLHCDVPRKMTELADVVVLYKEFPHTDVRRPRPRPVCPHGRRCGRRNQSDHGIIRLSHDRIVPHLLWSSAHLCGRYAGAGRQG